MQSVMRRAPNQGAIFPDVAALQPRPLVDPTKAGIRGHPHIFRTAQLPAARKKGFGHGRRRRRQSSDSHWGNRLDLKRRGDRGWERDRDGRRAECGDRRIDVARSARRIADGDTATSRPVAVLLRPGTPPSGAEIRNHLRRLVRRIRQHWPHTRLTIRGDGHCGRPEVMAWCEANGVDYILGLPGNKVLDRLVEPAADDVRVRRAEAQALVVRGYSETCYGAKSWRRERRVAARIEATTKGLDIRFFVTNIAGGSAEWLYDTLYCARGQAENVIKLHRSQLASDRSSCRSPLANQVRLVLHTAAYWLMLKLRDAIPRPQPLARAEFATLRMRLIKIGARIAATASRVRIALASAHPEAALFASLARSLQPACP